MHCYFSIWLLFLFFCCDNFEYFIWDSVSSVKCYHFNENWLNCTWRIVVPLQLTYMIIHFFSLIKCIVLYVALYSNLLWQNADKIYSCCRFFKVICVSTCYKNNSFFILSSLKSPSGKERNKHCYFEWRIYSVFFWCCTALIYFVPPVFAPYENVRELCVCDVSAAFVLLSINI